MDVRRWFERRIDPTDIVGGVAVGDLLAITLFVGIGQTHHGGDPLGNPLGVFVGAIPFYLAWIGVAFLAGLYTEDALVSTRRSISWSVPAWILAAVVALLLRGSPLFRGNFSLTFGLVALFFGGLLVLGWRALALTIRERVERRRSGLGSSHSA